MKTLKKIVITLAILLCFAPAAPADQFTDATYYIWRLINETRQRPIQSIARFGIDEARAREALGLNQWIMDRGLPPVAIIGELEASAREHNQDMITNLYYTYNSLDGRTPFDRISATGYLAREARESLGALAFTVFMDPMEAAVVIFSNLIIDELTPGNLLPKNIFNPDFTEVGISYSGSLLRLGPGLPLNVYLMVIDFAQPAYYRTFLIGNVFRDADGDGFMHPSEAIAGTTKVIRLPSQRADAVVPDTVFSSYQVEFSGTGFTALEAWNSVSQMVARQNVFSERFNQLVDLRVE